MSGAEVTEHEDGFLVSCETHGLFRKVETGRHAANLEALHNRVDHADDTDSIEVDLTAAAAKVLEEWCGCEACEAMLTVWQALTGVEGEADALALARQLAAAERPLVAAVPPF